jgi:predicted nucleic acid-binding protein
VAWLFAEPGAADCARLLGEAALVVASDLTLIECDRTMIRAEAATQLLPAAAAERKAALSRAAAHWSVFRLDGEVVERARRAFPNEPIRTLDAIHLATALVGRSAIGDLTLLSLDERVRENGRALGFQVLP